MRKLLITSTIIAALFATGCGIHRIDIQQGTVFTTEDVAQLKLGITQTEVYKILGTPPITDPFHKNRWDYVYTMIKPNETPEEKQITVFFENGNLIRVLTDIATDTTETPSLP
ncbi:MAG: outer membrane protein assembly factor BamE [Gammaproteobacteria bacterium]|nr:outer membrane protein assembly factor BamE [Gammaproteobacteria bacterium]